MLPFEKEMFEKHDPLTGILEAKIEEMKQHREAMKEKFKEYNRLRDGIMAMLNGLSIEEAEHVLESTKAYIRETAIVKAK